MAAKVPEIVRQQRERQISHRRTRDHLSDDALKDEIARLTSDLKSLRRKLRAERYRTRRLVNMISDLELLKKQAKKPRATFELEITVRLRPSFWPNSALKVKTARIEPFIQVKTGL